MDESNFYGAMPKMELAMLYAPDLKPYVARKRLNKWIVRNGTLLRELHERGYTARLQQLTTAHVRLIVKHLGEP
jgi:hypothetical protein